MEDPFEQQQFEKKYNTKIDDDTLFLIQNKFYSEYDSGFYTLGPYEWFEKQDYIIRFFRKL